jgi:hypothetical protein
VARRTKLGGVVGAVTSVATRALASAALAATTVVVDSMVDAIEEPAKPAPKITKKKAAAKKKL